MTKDAKDSTIIQGAKYEVDLKCYEKLDLAVHPLLPIA